MEMQSTVNTVWFSLRRLGPLVTSFIFIARVVPVKLGNTRRPAISPVGDGLLAGWGPVIVVHVLWITISKSVCWTTNLVASYTTLILNAIVRRSGLYRLMVVLVIGPLMNIDIIPLLDVCKGIVYCVLEGLRVSKLRQPRTGRSISMLAGFLLHMLTFR